MSEELAQDAATEKGMSEQMDLMSARIISLEESKEVDDE